MKSIYERYLFIHSNPLLVSISMRRGRGHNQTSRANSIAIVSTKQPNSSCFHFAATENTCIVVSDSRSTVCSDSELTRLKNGIQTTDKRTDSILIGFLGCWKNCALLFNATNSVCTSSKYPTTKTYRDAQKSTSTTASAAWGGCMTTCNNGNSEEIGLEGTGATYPTQPF